MSELDADRTSTEEGGLTPVIVVTGGGSGMGRQIAIDRVAMGDPVIVIGRREGPLRETASLSADPDLVTPILADLGDAADVDAAKHALAGRPVRGIVAAAGGQGDFGGARPESAGDVLSAWSDALSKNLYSAVLLIESLLPTVTERSGRIVLIGSTAGLDGAGGPYATAKAALHGYGRDLAARLGPRGITANVVAPGFVGSTEFFEHMDTGYDAEEMAQGAASRTPLGRVGTTRDISSCVSWLLSEDAGWTTGQTISVNGGTHIVR